MEKLIHSWKTAWQHIVMPDDHSALMSKLILAYSESHRKYHTLQHLEECITHLEPILCKAEHADEVAIALWFHDAIYDVMKHDNEEQSAAWAELELRHAHLDVNKIQRIIQLILATRHSVKPVTIDQKILVDVDLSILGASSTRFAEYEQQIRQEYAWVPEMLFQSKRKAVLQEFLEHARIYNTEYFYDKFENQARDNLKQSIVKLGGE